MITPWPPNPEKTVLMSIFLISSDIFQNSRGKCTAITSSIHLQASTGSIFQLVGQGDNTSRVKIRTLPVECERLLQSPSSSLKYSQDYWRCPFYISTALGNGEHLAKINRKPISSFFLPRVSWCMLTQNRCRGHLPACHSIHSIVNKNGGEILSSRAAWMVSAVPIAAISPSPW